MNKKDLIKQLNIEMNALPIPDVLDRIRAKSDIIVPANSRVTRVSKKRSLLFRLMPAVMAFVIFSLTLANMLAPFNASYTTLTIDLNPSIELTLNSQDEVVEIMGINEDGVEFLENTNLTGLKYYLALENLLNKAKLEGYLQNAEENAVIFSVKNRNANVENLYKGNLQIVWNNYLTNNSLIGSAVFEDYDEELLEEFDELKQNFAQNVDITPAKYKYIKKVIARFPALSGHEEYLAKMNVIELYKLLNGESDALSVLEIINRVVNNIPSPIGGPTGNIGGGNGN